MSRWKYLKKHSWSSGISVAPCRSPCRLFIHAIFYGPLGLLHLRVWSELGRSVSALSTNESSWIAMVMGLQSCVWSGPSLRFTTTRFAGNLIKRLKLLPNECDKVVTLRAARWFRFAGMDTLTYGSNYNYGLTKYLECWRRLIQRNLLMISENISSLQHYEACITIYIPAEITESHRLDI